MYEQFLEQLEMYAKAIRILLKGYLLILILPPSKLSGILSEVRNAIQTTIKDYNLVLSHLYLYSDMKLVTFGIDEKKKKINNTMPCICASLHSKAADTVSN